VENNPEYRKPLRPYPLGWKAKLGLLTPSHDTGYGSYEFRVISPDGVVTLETRVMGRKLSIDQLQRMAEDAVIGAELLASAHADVIDYIPTAACFVLGVEGEKALVKEMEIKTNTPCTSGGQAVSEALRFMGAKKILVYVPTNKEITDITVRYFGDQGFEVVGYKGLGLEAMEHINRMSPQEIYADVVKLHRQNPGAEGVFITGGCFRTIEMIDNLEKAIGIPVVVTTPANMWKCLQMCQVPDLIPGFGKLLETPRL
jgi:maleate cis-trans isomerase